MKQYWRDTFSEREQKEIDFAEKYVRDFNHGTPGHTHFVIIARLAELLDEVTKREIKGMSS